MYRYSSIYLQYFEKKILTSKFLIFPLLNCALLLTLGVGQIDRKFHGHGKNDGFVLYEYIIKEYSSFCKYTNISVMKKMKKNNMSAVNRKYAMYEINRT